MNKVEIGLIVVSLLSIYVIYLCMKYSYIWCKNEYTCKRCGKWDCKHYNECFDRKAVINVLKLCDYSGYRISICNVETWPIPDSISTKIFPVDLIKDGVVLHFENSDDFLNWANLSSYHLRIAKSDKCKNFNQTK